MIRGLNKLVDASGFGYLMSTYTSHPGGFDEACEQAKQIAADMLRSGLVVFAPIAYGPGIEQYLIQGLMDQEDASYFRSHEFWMPVCERFFQRSDYGVVAMTPGWSSSKGIAIEFYYLARKKMPIYFYDVDGMQFLTIGEVRKKMPDELSALENLAAEVASPPYMGEFIEDQSEIVAGIIGSKIVKNSGVLDMLRGLEV